MICKRLKLKKGILSMYKRSLTTRLNTTGNTGMPIKQTLGQKNLKSDYTF